MARRRRKMRTALGESIDEAVKAGKLDPKAQSALIEASMRLADLMDEPEWPIVARDKNGNGKFDNVSPALLLKYCDAMGIVPAPEVAGKPAGKNPINAMRAELRHKNLKIVNG